MLYVFLIIVILFTAISLFVDLNYSNIYRWGNNINSWINMILNIISLILLICYFICAYMFIAIFDERLAGDYELFAKFISVLLTVLLIRFAVYKRFKFWGSKIMVCISIICIPFPILCILSSCFDTAVFDMWLIFVNIFALLYLMLLFYSELYLSMDKCNDIKIKGKSIFIALNMIYIVIEMFIFRQYFKSDVGYKVILIDLFNTLMIYYFIYLPSWLLTLKTDMKSRKYLCGLVFIPMIVSACVLLGAFENIRYSNMFLSLFFVTFKISLLQKNKIENY